MPALQTNTRTFTTVSQTVDLDVREMETASVSVTGTFVATVSFLISPDGTNFHAFNGTPSNSPTDASSVAAAGAFSFDPGLSYELQLQLILLVHQ